MNTRYNGVLLVSDARNFDVRSAINPFMDESTEVDRMAAQAEHDQIVANFKAAGAIIEQVDSPEDCQDGIYTANWALIVNNVALMAHLPFARQAEIDHAAAWYAAHGYGLDWSARDHNILFSGQGGALHLPGSNIIFIENGFRTDPAMNDIIAERFNAEVVHLTAKPERNFFGYHNLRFGWPHVITQENGVKLPQSPGYDIDLFVGILSPTHIVWAPSLLTRASVKRMRDFLNQHPEITALEASRREALQAYACNLVSVEGEDGKRRVVINKGATELIKAINALPDMQAIPTANDVIKVGGGGFRCISNILNDSL